MVNQLLQAALWYAKRGWSVFPCVPGAKRPLAAHGYKDATTDAAAIRAWWGRWPHANIGIATGAAGLVVVDCDQKNGKRGLDEWRELRAELGLDDNTPTVETPSGGLHVYYRANGHAVASGTDKLAVGVDVKAVGGYVVAPPSRTPQGEYGWALGMRPTDLDLLALPKALASLLAEPERGNGHRTAPPHRGLYPRWAAQRHPDQSGRFHATAGHDHRGHRGGAACREPTL